MWTRKDTKVELSVMRGGVSCSAGSHKSWWVVPTHHSLESLLREMVLITYLEPMLEGTWCSFCYKKHPDKISQGHPSVDIQQLNSIIKSFTYYVRKQYNRVLIFGPFKWPNFKQPM